MGRQEHILIIDDDVHTADYIAELLQAQGYQTDWAFDGEEALAKLRDKSNEAAGVEDAIDLVILDVMMPGIDGYEVVRRLKSDDALRHTSVIMVTGLGSSSSKTKGLELGADDYVTKPFTPEELLARVKAMLRVRAIERDVVQRNRELEALNTISRLTSHSLDPNSVLSTTLNQTLKLMSGRAALIALVDLDKEDHFVLRMHRGLPSQVEGKLEGATWRHVLPHASAVGGEERIIGGQGPHSERGEPNGPTGGRIPVNGGLIGMLVRDAETKIVTDLSIDPHLAVLTQYGIGAAACTPLTAQRGTVGVLAVFGEDDALWGEHSLRLLEAVGGQVGVAIENARLYTRVSNYAEELARSQAQLIQAEKLAAMGRLTASIAHELNNPLQAVQNCLHLIINRPIGNEKKTRYLTMAQEEVERLISTVQRMLDFYRLSPAQHRATDVREVVEDVLALANKRLQRGRVRVRKELAPNLPLLNVIKDQLKQVFLNLVINAIEAMPEGGDLQIAAFVSSDDRWVVISFQDQGVGLSQEAMGHLFEPFYTTKSQGTGLGLSVSYGIIEQHGGTIKVDSKVGEGSCFTIELPILDVQP